MTNPEFQNLRLNLNMLFDPATALQRGEALFFNDQDGTQVHVSGTEGTARLKNNGAAIGRGKPATVSVNLDIDALQYKSALLIDLLRVIEQVHEMEAPTGLSAVIDAAQEHAKYIANALDDVPDTTDVPASAPEINQQLLALVDELETFQGWEASSVVAAKVYAASRIKSALGVEIGDGCEQYAKLHQKFQKQSFDAYLRR